MGRRLIVRSATAHALLLGAALLTAAPLAAQRPPAGAVPPGCPPPGVAPAMRDTLRDTLVLSHALTPATDAATAAARAGQLREIARRLPRPATISFPGYLVQSDSTDSLGRRRITGASFSASLRVAPAPGGSASAVSWVHRSDSPELNEALLRAVRAADAAGAFRPALGQPGVADSAVVLRLSRSAPADSGAHVPLFPLAVPYLRLDASARRLGPPPAMRYPERERRADVEGEVVLEFVVDETGRADPATVRVVRSSHEAFTREALRVLGHYRYTPARAGECPARELVRQPVRFLLRD